MMVSDKTGWVEIETIAYKNALGTEVNGGLHTCTITRCTYMYVLTYSTTQHSAALDIHCGLLLRRLPFHTGCRWPFDLIRLASIQARYLLCYLQVLPALSLRTGPYQLSLLPPLLLLVLLFLLVLLLVLLLLHFLYSSFSSSSVFLLLHHQSLRKSLSPSAPNFSSPRRCHLYPEATSNPVRHHNCLT